MNVAFDTTACITVPGAPARTSWQRHPAGAAAVIPFPATGGRCTTETVTVLYCADAAVIDGVAGHGQEFSVYGVRFSAWADMVAWLGTLTD